MSALAAPARSWAAAGAAGRASRTAAAAAQRRRPMRASTPASAQTCGRLGLGGPAGLGHGEDLFEAHGPVALLDADEPAGADARPVDVDVDGVVGGVVEVDDRAVAQRGDVEGAQARAAELGPDAQRHVAQR